MSVRPVIVIAGIGNGTGTGAATARVFARAGYRVALIARNADHLNSVAKDVKQAGGEAATFPVPTYSYEAVTSVVQTIKEYKWSTSEKPEIRVALWNTGAGVWKGFLDVTEQDLNTVVDANITAPFAFSRQVILAFKENQIDELGKRGTLLFTGATASLRGNVTTSAFAAGKFALRALSQSLNKEFGKQNIHVAHAIIDGGILTDLSLSRRADPTANKEWKENADVRLDPESIAKSYLYLANQDRSAWTWELDLRPAHEKW
ncbi:short-chain dehydrogenase/reductase SDR [Laetiporus sulphureus 93-53]|uniref:Short-chain dehydrogenase/reductase SDR n=1 Tax=Laetiporus sulphureus 93-53 TaxID=1314785 RepID=A0A165BZX0_9APHY|nr:short-chain dehydrogenase/reductase SDR [Laetiporus sulphureus 93-53]KZT01951.1 short-chain dehydrogenase/reductase SDR [Laetiporus sulphureus 93-53]